LAVDWAAAEGWNPGLHDGSAFYETDPNGFFVGTLAGEPIACISAIAYDSSFGFLGFYIVKPEHRGRGYGLRIWNEATAYLGGRNIGLDGVIEQQANYAKSGFVLAHRNVRYQGIPPESDYPWAEDIVDLRDVPFDLISDYDRQLFPTDRDAFLRRWLALPESEGIALIDAATEIAGFGLIRRCRNGYKIGPLFADDPYLAERIFLILSGRVERDAPIYLDVPAPNLEATRLAERYGMQPVFETARMYTRGAPPIDLNRVFGITSFELG
jgi:hypothetical protein